LLEGRVLTGRREVEEAGGGGVYIYMYIRAQNVSRWEDSEKRIRRGGSFAINKRMEQEISGIDSMFKGIIH
jgi:hypothetical protein